MIFFNGYKDLLLNVGIILLPLVFYQYTMKDAKWFRVFSLYILFVIPMILTMSSPIKTMDTVYDLRAIPLTIGSLYGGALTSLLLYISLIAYRFSQGGLNLADYIIALSPSFILVFFAVKIYSSLRFRNKVLVSIFICFFIRLTALSIYQALGGKSAQTLLQVLLSSLPLFITQSFLTGFCVYIIESVRKNKQLQAEVIRTEKIRIVSDIAASVAHEVRNPLTAVRGFIQLLSENDLSEEKRRSYTRICLEELDRAQHIISDYLSLAKPEHDHIEYFDIKGEFQYITSILGSYANYQTVEIHNYVTESVTVIGSKSKFRQAIINFGKNSIEAMPDGGILEFRSQIVNNELQLLLIDSGIGMTSEQIGRLGTPFYSTKEKGTGLGTMVSYNIIRNMKGKIEVASKIGTGTTYTITLPLPS
ncbi:ATP-binding protein [Paenibacillus alkalitolerans]|uniref:ATP-binding protein n=1 Tax=Paenibacillus alkalitolerans TaxID=2799335 RepID=UPI0018F33525|nr:ATP-binding protein [Paenibacillus alkalitolerans]